jgi:hypothetical protein
VSWRSASLSFDLQYRSCAERASFRKRKFPTVEDQQKRRVIAREKRKSLQEENKNNH